MSEILLVHGACHGAWAREAVIPALATLGHRARAIDLPGRGGPAGLQDQAQAVLAALEGATVLVGHSAGGYAITAAAEADPARVAGSIHVAAYVPKPGRSLAAMRRAGPSQPLRGAFRAAAGIGRQQELPCGHTPFLALPQRLAEAISAVSRKEGGAAPSARAAPHPRDI